MKEFHILPRRKITANNTFVAITQSNEMNISMVHRRTQILKLALREKNKMKTT